MNKKPPHIKDINIKPLIIGIQTDLESILGKYINIPFNENIKNQIYNQVIDYYKNIETQYPYKIENKIDFVILEGEKGTIHIYPKNEYTKNLMIYAKKKSN